MRKWIEEFWSRQGERIFWLFGSFILSMIFIYTGILLFSKPDLKEFGIGLIGVGIAGLNGIHTIFLTRARGQDKAITTKTDL